LYPPIFEIAKDSATVRTALGTVPRLYLFGEAPPEVQRPYAVWQQVFGAPENYLGQAPDMDSFGTQIDVYGRTAEECRGVAKDLRDALQGRALVTAWNGEGREQDTRDYRFSFTVEFMESR
jgi:hypothetical protein